MENLNRLQAAQDALLEEYRTNLEDIYNIQDTLIQDILPSVADDLDLSSDACAWAKEWLSDTCAQSLPLNVLLKPTSPKQLSSVLQEYVPIYQVPNEGSN
jgi:hypothetical protein